MDGLQRQFTDLVAREGTFNLLPAHVDGTVASSSASLAESAPCVTTVVRSSSGAFPGTAHHVAPCLSSCVSEMSVRDAVQEACAVRVCSPVARSARAPAGTACARPRGAGPCHQPHGSPARAVSTSAEPITFRSLSCSSSEISPEAICVLRDESTRQGQALMTRRPAAMNSDRESSRVGTERRLPSAAQG